MGAWGEQGSYPSKGWHATPGPGLHHLSGLRQGNCKVRAGEERREKQPQWNFTGHSEVTKKGMQASSFPARLLPSHLSAPLAPKGERTQKVRQSNSQGRYAEALLKFVLQTAHLKEGPTAQLFVAHPHHYKLIAIQDKNEHNSVHVFKKYK